MRRRGAVALVQPGLRLVVLRRAVFLRQGEGVSRSPAGRSKHRSQRALRDRGTAAARLGRRARTGDERREGNVEEDEGQLKRAAIVTFVRAFLFALLGALAAGAIVLLVARLSYPWKTALIAGGGCLALGAVVVATSGLWLSSLKISAFKQANVTPQSARC